MTCTIDSYSVRTRPATRSEGPAGPCDHGARISGTSYIAGRRSPTRGYVTGQHPAPAITRLVAIPEGVEL